MRSLAAVASLLLSLAACGGGSEPTAAKTGGPLGASAAAVPEVRARTGYYREYQMTLWPDRVEIARGGEVDFLMENTFNVDCDLRFDNVPGRPADIHVGWHVWQTFRRRFLYSGTFGYQVDCFVVRRRGSVVVR